LHDYVERTKFDNIYGTLPITDAMVDGKRALESDYIDVDKSCAYALRGAAARLLFTIVLTSFFDALHLPEFTLRRRAAPAGVQGGGAAEPLVSMVCACALHGATARVLNAELTPSVPVEGGVVGMTPQAPRQEYA
jgi:hypothetical protein